MRIVVLAGGIGGARFLLGVRAFARETGAEVTAVVNVGDDAIMHGLRICPDLDSVMYTLGGGADTDRGWGRAGETWTVREELAAYEAEPTWFALGDRDIGTHLVRTRMLAAGYPLSAVTAALCARWRPGVHLLPATDDRLETHVVVPEEGGGQRAIHFQEWWVRHKAGLPARRFVFVGAETATPAPGVLAALAAADLILVAPSNPVVSIAPILAVPGLRAAVAGAGAPVVGVSPIINGAPVRGMADRCLAAIGVECTAAGVGRLYGGRGTAGPPLTDGRLPLADGGLPLADGGEASAAEDGLLDAWLVAVDDAATEVPGARVRAVPLWMTDEAATAAMVRAAVEVAGVG